MANKILNLDFSKDPIMPPIIYGRVGDEKMQTITVKISRRDEIPDLSDGVITFEGEPAGGEVKVFDSKNVSSNNAGLQKGTFEYTFPSAAFSIEGTYKRAYFSFQKDGKRDTTGDFKIIVKGNADIDADEAETIITEYNKLVTALNEAYQAALKKIDTDYDAVVARIESIKTEMNTLQAKIDKTVSDAEGRISKVATDSEAKINTTAKTAETTIKSIGQTVTAEMDKALEELRAADFYTQAESDSRYVNKTEMENGALVSKKTVINSQDWDVILDEGIYTVFGASGANRPYSGAAYGALVVYADNTFVSQTYMYKGETYTRSRQGSPATWTSWNKMLVEKEQPFEAWYSPGTNHVGFKNKARYNLGPEFSNVGQRLGLPMKSNPLEWNSGRWQAKVLRDCKLNVSGTVKYQVGGSRGVLYAYTHIDKGLDEGVGDLGIGSAVGAVGGLNYQNFAAFDLNVTLKKGEYFAFRLELAADKQLDNTQLSSMHITELV
ncbi:BppU family phage baseplate upper protein [Enterococcus faecalis]|uniref:BppU family phage baseplate upper protein n=1 Tax=Enterococcus faecalis TaxID=1351 RepID=UPI0022F0BAEE|nr:BppU family phage baseplate upper protein [Enterococcus faecalis]MCV6012548.1 BppU family phage baseplate upper protein [Enterococcus faecalis]